MPDVERDMCVRKRALDCLPDMATIVRDDDFRFRDFEECKPLLDALKELFDLGVRLGLTKVLVVVNAQVNKVSQQRLMSG